MLLRRLATKPLPLVKYQLDHRASSLISQRLSQNPRVMSTGASPKPANSQNQNPEIPTAKFSELGASRTVKIVVIIALTIGGTMETIFWTKVIWEKYFGGAEGKEEGEGI